jgi:hypothetical protein
MNGTVEPAGNSTPDPDPADEACFEVEWLPCVICEQILFSLSSGITSKEEVKLNTAAERANRCGRRGLRSRSSWAQTLAFQIDQIMTNRGILSPTKPYIYIGQKVPSSHTISVFFLIWRSLMHLPHNQGNFLPLPPQRASTKPYCLLTIVVPEK